MERDRLTDGRVKVRQLVLILAIAEHGSLLAAADALYVTQPSVSRSLRELEDVVGADLFIRGPRGVTPTRAGEILLEHARAVVGHLRTAANRIEAIDAGIPEPVTVCTNLGGTYSLLLPHAIALLKTAHPTLTVSVIELAPERLETFLTFGEVDMFVGRVGAARDSANLRRTRLYDEPVRVVARRGHPMEGVDSPPLRDLLDYVWILPNQHTQPSLDMNDWFEKHNVGRPTRVVECSSLVTLRTLLLETDAVAPVPMSVGAREPGLTLLDVEVETVHPAMGVVTLRDQKLSPSADILLSCLVQSARDLADRLTP